MAKRILSISPDKHLLESRALLFRRAGFEVVSAINVWEALHAWQEERFDLVIIGHTMSKAEKDRVAEWAKSKQKDVPILALHNSRSVKVELADYWAYTDDGPAVLVAKVKQILDSSAASAD